MNVARTETDYKIDKEKIKDIKRSNNEEIHIISAGPSIKNFNWRNLRGLDIMTVNDSLFHLPLKVTYHIYNEPPITELKNYKRASNFHKVQKFTTFKMAGWHQLSLYDGKNLAYILAIQLSIDLGYKKAYLYGYDFSCENDYVHWWDKERVSSKIINNKLDMLKIQRDIFNEFKKEILNKIELIHITE